MAYSNYGYEPLGEIVRRVSGRSLAEFAQERIFEPLGMKDTCYVVPDSTRPRVVRRPSDAFFSGPDWSGYDNVPSILKSVGWVGLDTPEWQETPWACDGAYSTAMDMARFGQMFLNHGTHGGTRILSPATVDEMTRNQIPGIGAEYGTEVFPEASWGFGWNVHGDKKAPYDGALYSLRGFRHSGGGGVLLWVDPVYEIVGTHFSVKIQRTADEQQREGSADLFINAVTASVMEV